MTSNQYHSLYHNIQFWALVVLANLATGTAGIVFAVLALVTLIISAVYACKVSKEFKLKEETQ